MSASRWPLLEAKLRELGYPDRQIAKCRERFLIGEREHGDSWLSWPDERFVQEADDEEADRINYGGMREVARDLRGGA